jgi:ribosome-binding factor A
VSRRTERVAEELREEVARLLAREIKDPRIGFVTVTRAQISPDLRSARVFVGVLGDAKQRRETLQGLTQATGYIRRAVGQRLRLRLTPELTFVYDEGIEATSRVAQLLDQVQADARDTSTDHES